MTYTVEHANQVASQLERFSTAFAHQVAGQFANLAFWLEEVVHAVAVIDAYPARFVAMELAQREWVAKHDTVVGSFCRHCGGECELAPGMSPPNVPRRIDARQMAEAKQRVKDAAYRFLLRGHRTKLLDRAALIAACERIGTSVDFADLHEEIVRP
jgi:hypothetical protein